MHECEVCGIALKHGATVYQDLAFKDIYFCSEDCVRQFIQENLGDYISAVVENCFKKTMLT